MTHCLPDQNDEDTEVLCSGKVVATNSVSDQAADNVGTTTRLGTWNDELTRIVIQLQKRAQKLATAAALTAESPEEQPIAPSRPERQLSSSRAQRSQSPRERKSQSPMRSHSSPRNATSRFPSPEATKRTRAYTCDCDIRHKIRRVYTRGLARPNERLMGKELREYGIDIEKVIFSHNVCSDITEFFVDARYVREFVHKLRQENVVIIMSFVPVEPSHLTLSKDEQSRFRPLYLESLRSSDRSWRDQRYRAYLKEYAEEIGLRL